MSTIDRNGSAHGHDGKFEPQYLPEGDVGNLTAPRVDRLGLVDGLRELATGVPPCPKRNPRLVQIIARAQQAGDDAASGSLDDDAILSVYDELDASLTQFCRDSRNVPTGDNPWDDQAGRDWEKFGHNDWLDAHNAQTRLREQWSVSTGTVVRTDYEMFTPAANAELKRRLDEVASLIDAAEMSSDGIHGTLLDHVEDVARMYREVHDTEPEQHIVDVLNPLLERRGYQRIDRSYLW